MVGARPRSCMSSMNRCRNGVMGCSWQAEFVVMGITDSSLPEAPPATGVRAAHYRTAAVFAQPLFESFTSRILEA